MRKFSLFLPTLLKTRLYHDKKFKIKVQNSSLILKGSINSLENSIFWNTLLKCDEGTSINILVSMLRVYENLVFWDIGANSGVYSLIVHMLKPQSIVIAFEPSSYCRTKIISNCKLNNFSYSFFSILDIENSIIYVSDLALGSTNEKKLLNYYTIDDNYTYGGRLTEINKKSVNTEVINITRAENLINLNPKILPDVIKIDIEGYEYLALSGFGVYIKKLKFILVEILSNEMASKLENIFPPGDFRYYSIDDRNHFVENRSHLSKSPSRNWAIVRNDQQPALGILNSWN